ncbi:MAG: LysM peptidoglycan-binding domain-containing protein [Planctomycetes bacterium]|nr:LysM peptidoglycan-binding domain-containing protein [Planctomycetota bacterium]
MARETKIGLIAGLGFIVCFAIILTNRGRPNATGGSPPYGWREGRHTPAARDTIAPRRSAAPRRYPDAAPTEPSASAKPSESDVDRPVAANFNTPVHEWSDPTETLDPVVPRGRDRMNELVDVGPGRSERRVPLSSHVDHGEVEYGPAGGPADSNGAAASPDRNQQTTIHIRPGAPWRPESSARVNSPHDDGPVVTYTVVSGDTLSSIAHQHYGTKSQRVIDAIFDANRQSLPNRDSIRIGSRLVLPGAVDVGETAAGSATGIVLSGHPPVASGSMPNDGSVRSGGPKEPRGDSERAQSTRWYEVKKKDRYISIARTQLGDESRWREIHELNKDKFPDPDRIRAGVRIRLPD